MGGQDSAEFASEFVSSTGTGDGSVTMIWDPSFDSWRQFGIRSQPYWILYDDQGNELSSAPGAIDFEEINRLLAS